MINVLLISPRLDSTDRRYNGDNAYTDLLLQHPPAGVRYLHYEDLLAQGKLRKIRNLYRIGPRLVTRGILPPDFWAEYIDCDLEPDIIHIYGFSAVVKLPRSVRYVPVILGTSTGSYSDLKFYHGWPDDRISLFRKRKRLYLKTIGAYDSSLNSDHSAHIHTWSKFSRSLHLNEGFVRPQKISVIYPGLPAVNRFPSRTTPPQQGPTFLFVGSDYERKNGHLVFEAFRKVRIDFPTAQLILVGKPRNGDIIRFPGVTHLHFVPRQELLQKFFPFADVLVLPSRAEGFGMVMLEAMACGKPVIGVDAWAMPEIIEDGTNGFLVSDCSVDELADQMRRLVEDKHLLQEMSENCRKIFTEKFSIERHNEQLSRLYATALQQ